MRIRVRDWVVMFAGVYIGFTYRPTLNSSALSVIGFRPVSQFVLYRHSFIDINIIQSLIIG